MKSNRELLLQLGHRVRACPGFRWLPGMLPVDPNARPHRWLPGRPRFLVQRRARIPDGSPSTLAMITEGCIPHVGDAATIGCLAKLVREAWGDPDLVVQPRPLRAAFPYPVLGEGPLWDARWWLLGDGWCAVGRVEAEPLVVALEGVSKLR